MADYGDYLEALGIPKRKPEDDPVLAYANATYGRGGAAPAPAPIAPLEEQPSVPPPTPQLPMAAAAPAAPPAAPPGGKKPPKGEDEFMRARQETTDMQVHAVQRQQAAEVAQASEVAEKSALAETQNAVRQREIEEQRGAVYADADKRQRAVMSEVETLGNTKIDPKRVFKNNAGGTIATAALGFLSGFLNPRGGANDIVQMVDGIIQRDVASQSADLENKRAALGAKQQGIQTDLARGLSQTDSQLAAQLRGYDSAIKIINAEAVKKWGGEIGAAKAQGLVSGILEKRDEAIQQHKDTVISQGLQKSQVSQGWARIKLDKENAARGWAQNELDRFERMTDKSLARAAKTEEAKAKNAGLPEGTLSNTGDPKGYSQLNDKSLLPKAIEVKTGAEQKIAINRQMLDLMNKYPGHQWDNFVGTDEGKAMMEKVAGDMVLADAAANGQGALGDAEYERRRKQLIGGEIGAWFGGNRPKEKVFRDSISQAEKKYNAYMATVSNGWEGGLAYDANKGGWYRPVAEESGPITPPSRPTTGPGSVNNIKIAGIPYGAIIGDTRTGLTRNARGVDSNGKVLDVPPVAVTEDAPPVTSASALMKPADREAWLRAYANKNYGGGGG